MRVHALAAGCFAIGLTLSPGLAPAAPGDAAGQAQNTSGRPGDYAGVPQGSVSAARTGGAGSDDATANPAAGRTERMPGSAPGGQPTKDPGRVVEMGSPGTETNPGTAGPNTGAPAR